VPDTDPATLERVRVTLAEVRAGGSRRFVCRGCGAEAVMLRALSAAARQDGSGRHPHGRLPTLCEDCEPRSPTWRRERAERPLREALLALADRVDELEDELAGESVERALEGGDDVARLIVAARDALGEPDRYALGRAVRMLAAATGLGDTRARLRLLAGVALGWERRLGADGRYPGSREAA
jgi:hypothetical protein